MLFDFNGPVPIAVVNPILAQRHYLGTAQRGIGWIDEDGVLVLQRFPNARMLPQDWWELTRWCLNGNKNGGSRQWAKVVRWLKQRRDCPRVVVSYSDPSVGHTGSLYKACNWIWKPTWHRITPPPTGNGSWGTNKIQSPKDRWIYVIKKDKRVSELACPLQAAGASR